MAVANREFCAYAYGARPLATECVRTNYSRLLNACLWLFVVCSKQFPLFLFFAWQFLLYHTIYCAVVCERLDEKPDDDDADDDGAMQATLSCGTYTHEHCKRFRILHVAHHGGQSSTATQFCCASVYICVCACVRVYAPANARFCFTMVTIIDFIRTCFCSNS